MNKRIAILVAALFIAGLFAGAMGCGKSYAKEYKIGYIDPGQIMEQYKKAKDAVTSLRTKAKAKEDEMKVMVDEINKLKEEQALLSDKAKAEKEKVINSKIKTFQESRDRIGAELMKEENAVMGVIFKEIQDVINVYGKEKGYDIIIHKRVLLYGSDECDLTNDILKRLNK